MFVLAGGQGERLYPLTRDRAKPAVPFAGHYRIIDFTLSNAVNSGLRRIHVLTQYKSLSLSRHIRRCWHILNPMLDEFIDVIPPQQRSVNRWYLGTADAIFQNIYTLEEERPRLVLILSGDHVYRMNYRELIAHHDASQADLTIACVEVPRDTATQLGVAEVNAEGWITAFHEKSEDPPQLADNPGYCLASMGVYVFDTSVLVRRAIEDAKADTVHDFGRNVIPRMVREGERVEAYRFRDWNTGAPGYWRDIGALDSYYAANMDLTCPGEQFDLYDHAWPIRTYQQDVPPMIVTGGCHCGPTGVVERALVSGGAVINGGVVRDSVLSPRVRVEPGAEVVDSIIFRDVVIGARARVHRTIIDSDVQVPPSMQIGCDPAVDRSHFTVTDTGIVVVPKGMPLGDLHG